MIRLKELLLEGRTDKVSKSQAREIFVNKIQPSFSNPEEISEIYRGVDYDFNFGWIEPSNYKRTSAHTKNYYTLILDNSSRWESYPDRSRSIVCTSSSEKASQHGQVYRVFPLPNSKVGVCPVTDIWASFWKVQYFLEANNLHDFNEFLNLVYLVYGSGRNLTESWPELKNELNEISNNEDFLEGEIPDNFKDILSDYKINKINNFVEYFHEGGYDTFFEMLDHTFDPKDNEFELKRFKPEVSMGNDREVWTSSNSLMVKNEFVDDIMYENL